MPVINLPLEITPTAKSMVTSHLYWRFYRNLEQFFTPLHSCSPATGGYFSGCQFCVKNIMAVQGILPPCMCLFSSFLIPASTPQCIALSRLFHGLDPFCNSPSQRASLTAPWGLLWGQQTGVVKEEKPRFLKLVLLWKPVTSEATIETIMSNCRKNMLKYSRNYLEDRRRLGTGRTFFQLFKDKWSENMHIYYAFQHDKTRASKFCFWLSYP